MRTRFKLLFLLLVAVPLALIVWLGVMLAKQEHDQAEKTWQISIDERLANVDKVLAQEMNRLEEAFDELLKNTPLNVTALEELPRHQAMIRYAFLLNSRGRLEVPSPSEEARTDVVAFLRRTSAVWESGVRFENVSATQESNGLMAPNVASQSSLSGETFLKKVEVRPAVRAMQNVVEPVVKLSGWHVWFHGGGPQMIFWQKRQDGRVVGIEVEMAALTSLLINQLSHVAAMSGEGLLKLMNADGKLIIHQVGNPVVINGGKAAAQRVLSGVLSMWHLEYFPSQNELPKINQMPILLGAGGAVLTLIALAWLFHRESTREMREAQRRVSFVNQVSHELKTPLTNIRLYAEMAQQRAEESGDLDVLRHLAVVESETSRLGRLIHNVLTFAQQQRDQLVIRPQKAVLDEVVKRAIDIWKPALEAKGFTVKCDFNAAQTFSFDADAVEQILGNLMSNVEKYAAAGRYVCIATNVEDQEASLSVEDRGPGIPLRQQEQVFSPFVRLRNDLAEGVTGTGIGLGISRQLAMLHGGTLKIEKASETGAKFVLRLPRQTS